MQRFEVEDAHTLLRYLTLGKVANSYHTMTIDVRKVVYGLEDAKLQTHLERLLDILEKHIQDAKSCFG